MTRQMSIALLGDPQSLLGARLSDLLLGPHSQVVREIISRTILQPDMPLQSNDPSIEHRLL